MFNPLNNELYITGRTLLKKKKKRRKLKKKLSRDAVPIIPILKTT
jgi:hypothetical protein